MQQEGKNLKDALYYLEHGWSIIPIKAGEKTPLIPTWLEFQKRQATKDEVTKWFTDWPDANLAIIVGQISGLLVIDIDDPIEGEKSFRKYFGDVKTLTVKTPRGTHYYFKHPGDREINNAIRAAPGLDIKGDGGYVLAPPSVGYTWIKNVIVDLPNQTLLTENKAKKKVDLGNTEDILEGGRDNAITKKAGKLLAMKHSVAETFGMCQAYNLAFCKPPLPESDIKRIVTSIAGREQEKQSSIPPIKGKRIHIMEDFDTIEREDVTWLWPQTIPCGMYSLLIGDPGVGKSMFTVDLAARISAGLPLPDGTPTEAGNVLMVFNEDLAGHTVRPRLEAAGANLKRIKRYSIQNGVLSLQTDIEELVNNINRTQAKLLVLDPIVTYGGKTNSWKDDEVRQLLEPVVKMAEKTNCAIVGIMHLNKKESTNALQKATGSGAWVAVARSVLMIGVHPDDRELEKIDRRYILASAKCNLSSPPPTRIFNIIDDHGIGRMNWIDETSKYGTEDILRSDMGFDAGKLEQATIWLKSFLQDGPIPPLDVISQGKKQGFSQKTLERVKDHAGIIQSKKTKDGWVWELLNNVYTQDSQNPWGF